MSESQRRVAGNGRSITEMTVIVIGAALLLRLAMCVWGAERVPPTADGAFYHVVAQRIAQGLGYTWLWPDGAVTHAAHYPVGYPAMVGVAYRFLGPRPVWAMVENAVLGALGTGAAFWLATRLMRSSSLLPRRLSRAERLALSVVAVLLVCSPTFLLYTPALMTESCVGSLLVGATLLTCVGSRAASRMRQVLWFLSAGVALGFACLLRPQSVLLAPVLGLLSGSTLRHRIASGALLTVFTVALVAPWTVRNCNKLDHCVFVSANGGWNLLIGTFPEGNGAWIALDGERVPAECREVFSESGKDACFGRAGRARIVQHPVRWLGLVPAKLRATFDHGAAGTEHLFAARAISEKYKSRLQILEYAWQRICLILALMGAHGALGDLRGHRGRSLLLGMGIVGSLGGGAWIGWCVLAGLVASHVQLRRHVAGGAAVGAVASTLVIHALFFGAGRYSIPLWYSVAPLMALGVKAIIEVGFRRGF